MYSTTEQKEEEEKKKNTSCLVVRIGIDLSQICLFFFFFILLTRGRRTSAGLNKSSSRSSIHLQPSDFPARRNDQTNLCDRDTSVEKVGRLKSKFKSHPPSDPPPPPRPTAVPFYSRINETWCRDVCWCARSWNELLAILRQFQTAFFFFFSLPNQKSRVKAALTAETDIRVFIAERIIYHGRPLDLHWIVLRIIRACHC